MESHTVDAQINRYRLYSVQEAARILGVTDALVRKMIGERELLAKRVRRNSRPRIPGQAILSYLQVDQS